jgi:2-polyprenyl-3-methyl-5-hydroxy-6-metoxy-1,4-benzoquinol methylase
MPEVTITDLGDHRHVEIHGEHRDHGQLVSHDTSFDTHYSQETLDRTLAVKGSTWLKDEIDRSEDPNYVQAAIQLLFGRFLSFTGKHVLDFGCGCGATAIVLARMGARVISVDPDGPSIHAGRLRARDSQVGDSVSFCHVRETDRLPFPDGTFDTVLCYQVLEHIPPPERVTHVQEMWRVIRPGGHLLVSVPNRLWPIEFHTTGLWFVPYLPFALARRYAVLRGRLSAAAIHDPLLAEGMRGVTYRELLSWLPESSVKVLNVQRGDDLEAYFALSMSKPQTQLRIRSKRVLESIYQILDELLWQPLSIPACAFLPYLVLCIEKAMMA